VNVTKRESKPPGSEKTERQRRTITAAELDELIEEATVDCSDESEQMSGFYAVLEENLGLPFQTHVLGVQVTVEDIELTDAEEIVAICKRGQARQVISILELPLPVPPPSGAEWIEAYRRWMRRQAGLGS
jgi:calcium binding protein